MNCRPLWPFGNPWGSVVKRGSAALRWSAHWFNRYPYIPMTKAQKELHDLEVVFGSLAHPSRRQILLVLKLRGGAMTAGGIAGGFSCKWPTTTRHLRTLENAGLISVRKEGRERLYELNRNRLVDTVTGWLKWFGCQTRMEALQDWCR